MHSCPLDPQTLLHVQQQRPHACASPAMLQARAKSSACMHLCPLDPQTLLQVQQPRPQACTAPAMLQSARSRQHPCAACAPQTLELSCSPVSQMRSNSVRSSWQSYAASEMTVGGSCFGSPASTTHSAPRTCTWYGIRTWASGKGFNPIPKPQYASALGAESPEAKQCVP